STLIGLADEPRATGAWLDSPFADISELVFVQGTADRRVHIQHHRELMAAARQARANASEWVVDGAAHVEAAVTAPAEYERRLVAFFSDLIGRRRNWRGGKAPTP